MKYWYLNVSLTVPGKPTNVQVSSIGKTEIMITFDDPLENPQCANGYAWISYLLKCLFIVIQSWDLFSKNKKKLKLIDCVSFTYDSSNKIWLD